MFANTGNQGVWVGRTHPEISRMVLLSWLSIDAVWLDLDQAGQQYSATEQGRLELIWCYFQNSEFSSAP